MYCHYYYGGAEASQYLGLKITFNLIWIETMF